MPFTVEPSDQVVIDWSDAGPNDALRLVTQGTRAGRAGVTYFCMIRYNGYRYLCLVPEAIPGSIRSMAYKAARELIGSCGTSKADAGLLEQWLAEQPGAERGLLKVVADRLLDEARVQGGSSVHDNLNIGTPFSVRFSDQGVLPSRLSGHIRTNTLWSSPGMIVKIEPVPRFVAEMHAAARY